MGWPGISKKVAATHAVQVCSTLAEGRDNDCCQARMQISSGRKPRLATEYSLLGWRRGMKDGRAVYSMFLMCVMLMKMSAVPCCCLEQCMEVYLGRCDHCCHGS